MTILCLAALCLPAIADESSKTVIGPPNPDLHEGAMALIAGDAERGVRLTLRGLNMATNRRERITAFSNLCAGYLLLDELDNALPHCDRALELDDRNWRAYCNRALVYIRQGRYEDAGRDLDAGFEIRPESSRLRRVRALLLDETDPVTPRIVIDDRRQPPDDDSR